MATIIGTPASEMLEGGPGDDQIEDTLGGSDTLNGNAGNDTLIVTRDIGMPPGTLILNGGDGKDDITYDVRNASAGTIDGGAGDDIVRVGANGGTVAITTGAGFDVITLDNLNIDHNGALLITDFTPFNYRNPGYDSLDWDGLRSAWFTNWDGSNPFVTGHARFAQFGDNAVLQIDRDGGGDNFVDLVIFQDRLIAPQNLLSASAFPNLNANDLGYTPNDPIFFGTEQDDHIAGSIYTDRIFGLGGNDRIVDEENTAGTADYIDGGDGDDIISISPRSGSNASTITVLGGAGNDTLEISPSFGTPLTFSLALQGTSQLINGMTSVNASGFENIGNGATWLVDVILTGDDGDNRIYGGVGSDRLFGGGGNDHLFGGNGYDYLDGGDGDDEMDGGSLNDILYGQGGNDSMLGGDGDDLMDGGAGINTASYDGAASGVAVTLLQPGVAQDTLGAGIDTLLNIQNLTGSAFNDTLTGDNTANVLMGLAGDDTLIGGRGNDELNGGEGYDIAQFASTVAASQITFENGAIVVNGPDGRDVLTGIEQLLFTDGIVDVRYNGEAAGQARMELQGTDGADTLTGGQSWDSIFGNGGNDRLIGGEGNDFLDGGAGVDTAVYGGLFRSYQTSQTQVSGAITGTDTLVSIENQSFIDGQITYDENSNAAALYRLYDATLDRGPDSLGFLDWLRTLDAGTTLNQAAAAFVASPEFVNRYGNLSNQAFVEQLYAFTLNREGDAPGVAAWVGQLDAGTSRADVVLAFSESGEHRALSAPVLNAGIWIQDDQTMALARLYDATFDRLPDATGLENWRGALAGGTTLAQAAVAFAGSQEFQNAYGNLTNQTFVEQLYRFTLNREGDAQGIGDWVAYLDNGGSRSGLLLLFSESTEHIGLTQPLWERGITTVGTDLAATGTVAPLSGDLELLQATHGIEDPGDSRLSAFDVQREAYDFHAHVQIHGADGWLVG